jgi:hypothetical protein
MIGRQMGVIRNEARPSLEMTAHMQASSSFVDEHVSAAATFDEMYQFLARAGLVQ